MMNFLFLLSITSLVLCQAENGRQRHRRSSCGTDPSWDPTPAAYESANTDESLESWWRNISSRSSRPLPYELAEQFGGNQYDFACGIGAESTCIVPGCADFDNNGSPPWPYLALQSISQLNILFNMIYEGVVTGQEDYEGLLGNVSEDFFTWNGKEPESNPGAKWGSWAASTFGGTVGEIVGGVIDNTSPDMTSGLSESEGEADLGEYAATVGQTIREWLEDWANTTFNGNQSAGNETLFDYLRDGNALSMDIPEAQQVEQFYKNLMISKAVTDSWTGNKTFIFSALTHNPNDNLGPNSTKYYSEAQGRVYYMYTYKVTGRLSGRLVAPRNVDLLNAARYGIDPRDITKSSAMFWESSNSTADNPVIGNTSTIVSENGTSSPFSPEGAWRGLWTLPVCDIGTNVGWNVQYDHDPRGGYGTLPCCCGPNCSDTRAFVESVNMKGLQTLLVGCKKQLRQSNTTVKYSDIDYGFKEHLNFRQEWDSWSVGIRAGVGIGMTIACLIPFFLCCCLAIIND